MANNLPPPKIAIFRRVIWSAGRRKSLSVRSGGAGFDRFRFSAQNYPFDTSHLGQREHSGPNPRAVAVLSDPLGVVALLIDLTCCYRTAPCPHQLGEKMTGSRTNPALPQRICTITAWRRLTTTHPPPPIFRLRRQHASARPAIKNVRPRYAAGAAS